MNSKRIFSAPAVLTAVLILGSVSIIIYSQWVIGQTLDRHKALVTLCEIAKRKILLAHLWLEEALAGDQSINLDQNVYRNIDGTLDLISTGLENVQADGGKLRDVTRDLMRGDLAAVQEKIQGWRKLAEVRWENRDAAGETGGELDQEFDAVFRDILARLQNFSDALNLFIAQDRRKLEWFSVLHVFLLIALCGSTGVIVFRYQRAIEAKNEELEIRIKERTFRLARSENSIRSILNSAVNGIVTISEHGIVELFNPAAERMFNYRADEIIGKTVALLMPESYKSEHDEYIGKYLREGKSNIVGIGVEVIGQRRDGSTFPIELAVSEVRVDDRRLFAGIVRDITEQKQAEERLKKSREQLVHAEKLSAIGKLAASMAHEFNNPIYGIRNVLEQIEERVPMNDAYKEMAGLAVRECNRMAELIRKLQDFNRPSSGIIALMDVHEAINDMLILSQKKLKERKITLEKRYADDMPMIEGVADQIRQVILNLLQNAEEAIPEDGGKITIRTAARDKTIEVHIQNTGRGISPENMKMIFDPFFTTKSAVKGTGLGLSVSYGIVKSHGGDIQVNSKPEQGTTFIVSLPREPPNEIALHRKRVDA